MDTDQYAIQERTQKRHWWYEGRRLLLRKLLDRLTRERGTRFPVVLDVGSGAGGNAEALRPFADKLVAVDMSADALAFCRAKGYDVCVPSLLQHLDVALAGTSGDCVVAMDVLEHVEDDAAAAAVLFRSVTPGGFAIVTVPTFQSLWGIQDEVSQHFRRYRLPQVCQLLKDAGFIMVRKTYFNTFLFPFIWFARKIMHLFPSKKIRSENELNNTVLNAIFSWIFRIEVYLVSIGFSFPFGVSGLVVVKKPLSTSV